MEKKLQDYAQYYIGCDTERWRRIPGYEGLYEASSEGRIRSLNRIVMHNYGGLSIKKGKILSFRLNPKGYYECGLTIKNKVKTFLVHRLVSFAFHANPENKRTVNHKDLNKLNNKANNLEWATQKEQVSHFIKSGFKKVVIPTLAHIESIRKATLKPVLLYDTINDKTYYYSGISECSGFLGITQPGVSKAIKRENLVLKKYTVKLAIDAATLPK